MNEPTLISESDILATPSTRRSLAICNLYSSPLRDLTSSTSPSTPSMVPRTRDGDGGCCATAYSDEVATITTAISGRMNEERQTAMSGLRVGGPPVQTPRRRADIS